MKKPSFLKKVKRLHFVGIKGVGMTALACCAQDLGLKITGTDVGEIFVTDEVLAKRKIDWQIGFNQKLPTPKPDLVITTGAHGGLNNPQVKMAQRQKIKILTQAEALAELMEGKEGISVCGVGGKSTTSAILATVLEKAQQKPSFAVGVASIDPLGFPGRYREGRFFVAEADEYANSPGRDNRPKFLFQKPKVIVVTNIEYDHPDIYQNLAQVKKAYQAFFQLLPKNGLLVACADNQNVIKTVKNLAVNAQLYGFSPQADWKVEKAFFGQGETFFDLSYKKAVINRVKLKVPGRFNVLNAAAVLAVGTFLGLDALTIKKGLAAFGGTRRRFEFIAEVAGIRLYDDYAHHPEEIKATLAAARDWFPGQKITVVFQPHTFSRTKALFDQFARCFSLAHRVIITDIYASAREKDDLDVSGELLAKETAKHHSQVIYLKDKKAVADFLAKTSRKGGIILTMGAGDIFSWPPLILKSLKASG